MNSIKMSDCRFYVNEEERTVICVIPNTRRMLLNFIEDNFIFPDFEVNYAMQYRFVEENLKMPYSFMGKSVCSAEDKWDETTGRLIAYSRAKDKCYKSFFKRANKLIQMIDSRLGDMIELFNNFGMKLEVKRDNLQEKIDALVAKE